VANNATSILSSLTPGVLESHNLRLWWSLWTKGA